MTEAAPPTGSDPGAIFDAHVRAEFVERDVEATMATMSEAPYVTHVPVLTGGHGREEVQQFYSRYFIGRWPADTQIAPVSRTSGQGRVIDELIVRFTHDVAMPALLPGVPPTGRKVELPVVVVMGIEDGKVTYEHIYWDQAFAETHGGQRAATAEDVLAGAHVVSLHMNLTDENRHFINADRIARMPEGAIVINTARGGLVHETDVAEACRSGRLAGYGADVLAHEPIEAPHPFQDLDNVVLTPHVGSRTCESVERQAVRATRNLVNYLSGDDDYIQANKTQ